MAIEVQLIPTMNEMINGLPTTVLEVIIDMRSIQHLLLIYNLLVEITLEVGEVLPKKYVYTAIYEEKGQAKMRQEVLVVGNIKDMENIKASAKAVRISKT